MIFVPIGLLTNTIDVISDLAPHDPVYFLAAPCTLCGAFSFVPCDYQPGEPTAHEALEHVRHLVGASIRLIDRVKSQERYFAANHLRTLYRAALQHQLQATPEHLRPLVVPCTICDALPMEPCSHHIVKPGDTRARRARPDAHIRRQRAFDEYCANLLGETT